MNDPIPIQCIKFYSLLCEMIDNWGRGKGKGKESLFTQVRFRTLVDTDLSALIQALEGNFCLYLAADTLSFEDFLFVFNAYKNIILS